MVDTDEAHKNVSTTANARARGTKQFCAGCGANVANSALSCWRCGRCFDSQQNASWRIYDSFYRIPALVDHRVASPGKRVMAAVVDMSVLLAAIVSVELVCLVNLVNGVLSFESAATIFCLSLLVLPVIYYTAMEGSQWNATLGKRFAGIKVVDLSGRRITYGAAFRRHASKWLLLWPSIIMIAIAALAPLSDVSRTLLVASAAVFPGAVYLIDVLFSTRNKDNRSQLDRLSGTLVARAISR